MRRLGHLTYHRLLDLRKLCRAHRPQFSFRGREEGLEALPEESRLFIAALQQEAHPPLAPDVHRESKHRVAKLLFGAQLVIEPRLNNLPEQGAGGGAAVFIHVRRGEDGGQRRIGAVTRFFKNRQLLTVDQDVFVATPLIAIRSQLLLDLTRHGGGLFGGEVANHQQLRAPFRFQVVTIGQHLFQAN